LISSLLLIPVALVAGALGGLLFRLDIHPTEPHVVLWQIFVHNIWREVWQNRPSSQWKVVLAQPACAIAAFAVAAIAEHGEYSSRV
jgi:hypothetical protein